MLSIIAAIGENRELGADNRLLWHLPNDMKRFRELTTGHPVIMGRHTFLSLPKGALPHRENIVVTHHPENRFEGCTVCESLEEVISAYTAADSVEAFLIGGASIYRQTVGIADNLYLTLVHHAFCAADVFFPAWDENDWLLKERIDFPNDEKHLYPYSFLTYVRK